VLGNALLKLACIDHRLRQVDDMQGISFRYNNQVPLATDMIVSNEPGYYEDGKFGVRIENLALIVEEKTEFNFAGAYRGPALVRLSGMAVVLGPPAANVHVYTQAAGDNHAFGFMMT
jgi:hypothetical protein